VFVQKWLEKFLDEYHAIINQRLAKSLQRDAETENDPSTAIGG
jgi:hypothetical protein